MRDSTDLDQATILIIDDSPANLGVLFNALKQFNCKLLLVQDVVSAESMIYSEQLDLILLNVFIREQSGYEACRHLKTLSHLSDVPIVFLSDEKQSVESIKVFESGGSDYINYPFNPEEVIARLITHLRMARLQKKLLNQANLLTKEIKNREELENIMLQQKHHELLTQLPNRVACLIRLEQALQNLKDEGRAFSVFFLNLDRFKLINESLGYLMGDELLKSVGKRLSLGVRDGDFVAHFGGDKFVLILYDIENDFQLTQFVTQIQSSLSVPIYLGRRFVFTTATIGVVIGLESYSDATTIIRDAEAAMYEAKINGGGQKYQLFHSQIHSAAMSRLQLEADLQQAIKQNEFVVYYQPIVDAKSGQIKGVESLLRWNHPLKGIIPPNKFIPIAEEMNLMVQLTRWMMETVCQQLKDWHDLGRVDMFAAINMSTTQLKQPGLIDILTHVLTAVGMPAKFIEIEITEGILTLNAEIDILYRLSNVGVRLSIDDFGIGSSLECLKLFPLDTLKIDQSFVRGMMYDEQDQAIIRAILVLARSLGLKVIAEGVETKDQLLLLQQEECDQIQGYLFGRPSLPEELTEKLKRND